MTQMINYENYMKNQVREIFTRRIETLPPYVKRKIFSYASIPVSYYFEHSESFLHLSICPAKELEKIKRRSSVFENAFPGLFSTNFFPCVYRPDRKPYRGAIKISGNSGKILFGPPDGSAVIVTKCFLHLEGSSSIVINNLTLRNPDNDRPKYSYQIYLTILCSFVPSKKNIFAIQSLEDALADFITKSREIKR